VESLQARSSEIFQNEIERHAPLRGTAILLGLAGCVLFWVIFGWPLLALYAEFFEAASAVMERQPEVIGRFPDGVFSMLMTSLLLALFPTALLLLVCVSWVTRHGKMRRCVGAIRSAHELAVGELTRAGLFKIRLEHPRLEAALRLLRRNPATISGPSGVPPTISVDK
jgi:hypothetical protein